jgi:hypothetical protein
MLLMMRIYWQKSNKKLLIVTMVVVVAVKSEKRARFKNEILVNKSIFNVQIASRKPYFH